MESVLKAAFIYLFIIVFIRVSGRRTLGQLTAFDFVLLLLIGESSQQGLVGEDFSVTNVVILVSTLIALDVAISLLKSRWKRFDKWLDGRPTILVDNGRLLEDRVSRTRLDDEDILAEARSSGLERMEQVKYAILEKNGRISIIPFK